MYKLTAICSHKESASVLDLLQRRPEVSNILNSQVLAGEAQREMVTAFVQREAIDIVLEHLRTLREWQPGELSFIEVDYVVRRDSEAAGFGTMMTIVKISSDGR